eukprot:TRINITY_DN7528_c1_g1_i7.p1 TRINITY_DN7528_c1_g1~~TRINITY_DN7528_c1_g1_i7.p1  ORF type:complete len:623 (-),score=122.21 TRINITY_DN7528_c1_g1_i7:265-2133(-)
MDEITLSVFVLGGDGVSLDVDPASTTVFELQERIHELLSVLPADQQLILGDDELPGMGSQQLLCDVSADFQDGAVLFLAKQQSVAARAVESYRELLDALQAVEADSLDWKAFAKTAACFYKLEEKQQCWDQLKLAVAAEGNYKVNTDREDLLKHPRWGKHFQRLQVELVRRPGVAVTWGPTEEEGVQFLALLVKHGRATDLFKDRFDRVLPNWFGYGMKALRMKVQNQLRLGETWHRFTWDEDKLQELTDGRSGNVFFLCHSYGMLTGGQGRSDRRMYLEAITSIGPEGPDFAVEVLQLGDHTDFEMHIAPAAAPKASAPPAAAAAAGAEAGREAGEPEGGKVEPETRNSDSGAAGPGSARILKVCIQNVTRRRGRWSCGDDSSGDLTWSVAEGVLRIHLQGYSLHEGSSDTDFIHGRNRRRQDGLWSAGLLAWQELVNGSGTEENFPSGTKGSTYTIRHVEAKSPRSKRSQKATKSPRPNNASNEEAAGYVEKDRNRKAAAKSKALTAALKQEKAKTRGRRARHDDDDVCDAACEGYGDASTAAAITAKGQEKHEAQDDDDDDDDKPKKDVPKGSASEPAAKAKAKARGRRGKHKDHHDSDEEFFAHAKASSAAFQARREE